MDYRDFEIQVSRDDSGSCWIEVVDSPAGEIEARVEPLTDLSVLERLRANDEQRRAAESRSGTTTRDIRVRTVDQAALAGEAEAFGQRLFNFLLPGEVLAVYRNSLAIARRDGRGLRLRLRFQDPALAALPWELMHDAAEKDHVALDPETPIVRHLEIAREHVPLTIVPPLRILGMISSPRSLRLLDVERERTDMAGAIRHLVDAGFAHLQWVEGQTWRDLHRATMKNDFHVFHFIGHGGFNDDEGLIVLADDAGEADPVSATRLGRLLSGRTRLRLVVLNSCEGARAHAGDLQSSVAGVLIRHGIPAVVSMQFEITDTAALEFSRTFYDALSQRLPVDTSVTEARKAVKLADEDSLEFATPVLHMRAPDGRLFDIDVAGAIFGPADTPRPERQAAPSAVPDRAAPVNAVTRPLAGGDAVRAVPPGSESPARPTPRFDPTGAPLADSVRQPLLVLLNKTRRHWIDDVLTRSLAHSGLIELHLETAETMVQSPWGNIPMAPGQSIADVFEELGGCFLILGVPGSGKTTTLLTLARDLLDRAESDPSRQLPVVLPLSSMRANDSLDGWVASELGSKYQVPRRIGETWMADGRLMLLLDGLDETPEAHQAGCVNAINAFLERGPGLNVVVCSRLNEYLRLPVRLRLNGAVTVGTLTRDQILKHVASRGPAHAGLLHALERDSSLQILAQTPFMLSLMLRTYRDVPVEKSAGFTTIEARKNELLEAWVQRQFRAAGQPGTRSTGP